MYLVIAVTGQMCEPVRPIDSVTLEWKGSVFDTLRWTCMYMGLCFEGRKVMSLGVMCMLGLNCPVHVNSLTLRNPKKARVRAAHSIMLSKLGLDRRSWKSVKCVRVIGSQVNLMLP